MPVSKSSRDAHNRHREPRHLYMPRNIDIADAHDDIMYPSTLPFILLHLSCVLAFLAQSTVQKSVLWWAAKHRHHHLHSDTPDDVHSPRHKGFFYSHVGWIFFRQHDLTDLVKVADFASFPELRWLHRFEQLPAVILALLCFAIAGWSGLVVGFVWSTVL